MANPKLRIGELSAQGTPAVWERRPGDAWRPSWRIAPREIKVSGSVDQPENPVVEKIWQPTDLSSEVWQRPSGSDYVTWESLVTPAEAAAQAANPSTPVLLTASFVKSITGNKILSLPPGIFEAEQGWNNYRPGDTANNFMIGLGSGYASGVRGIVGSGSKSTPGPGGAETIIRMTSPMPAKPRGSEPSGSLIILNNIDRPYLGGFSLHGVQTYGDNVFHGGISLNECKGNPLLENLYLINSCPGYSNFPPGETFGINVYRSPDVLIRDCEIDGRDLGGNRTCASPIGWNNCGYTGTGSNPVANAFANTPGFTLVQRVYAHHGLTGMLTFWDTKNIRTEDYYTFSWSSGPGEMSGSGINHEQSDGEIRHIRPRLFINSTRSSGPVVGKFGHPADDMTKQNNTSSATMNVYNSFSDGMVDMEVWYPQWDNSLGNSGVFCLAAYEGYSLGFKLETPMKVYIKDSDGNDVQLTKFDHPNPGWESRDPLANFVWIH